AEGGFEAMGLACGGDAFGRLVVRRRFGFQSRARGGDDVVEDRGRTPCAPTGRGARRAPFPSARHHASSRDTATNSSNFCIARPEAIASRANTTPSRIVGTTPATYSAAPAFAATMSAHALCSP